MSCLRVDRRHQFALAQANEVAAVDNVAEMTFEPRPGAGEARHAQRQGNEIAAERAASRAVVAHKNCGGALSQSVDSGEPGEAEHLPRHDGEKRHNRDGCQYGTDAAEPGGAVEQILDQIGDPEAGREQQEARGRDPEQACPGHTAAGRRRRNRQGSNVGGRRCPHPTLPRLRGRVGWRRRDAARFLGWGHDDAGVVEAEYRWFAGTVHMSRSPIRNCSARSSRIWGSAGTSSPVVSSGGGRKRTKRKSVSSPVAAVRPRNGTAPGANRVSGSSGSSPGNTATAVMPSNILPLEPVRLPFPECSPVAGTPRMQGSVAPPRRTSASRVARTADSAITSTAAPATSACAMARSTMRRRIASNRSWLV